jgi:hypothetical protein
MWTFLWMSDIHLDFLTPPERKDFLRRLKYFHFFGEDDFFKADGILAGGDISNCVRMADDLRAVHRDSNGMPVYYVPGNHDYYGGTIQALRANQVRLHRGRKTHRIYALELSPGIRLGLRGEIGLVGHGCWGDTRGGDYWNSDMHGMSDFREIWDFKHMNLTQRKDLLMKLGDAAAAHLKKGCIALAASKCRHVVVLTHVPPFAESSLYEGRVSARGLPYFCCQAAGTVLEEVARQFPQVSFTILSGHSHEETRLELLPNLTALVRKAEYYEPSFDRIRISVEGVEITDTIGNKGSLQL